MLGLLIEASRVYLPDVLTLQNSFASVEWGEMTRSTNKLCNSLMYDDEGRLALLQHENIVMPLVIIVKLLNPTLQIAGEKLDNRQKSEDTNIYIYILYYVH